MWRIGMVMLGIFVQQTVSAQSDFPHRDLSIEIPTDSVETISPEDSVQVVTDTVPPKSNAIDAPVHYAAKDSTVMVLDGRNMMYLYGEGSVQYMSMDLTGEYIEVNTDSSIVYATHGLDSIGEEFGYPIFKDGETQYEMKKARYNFKTKKMFVYDVITQQGEGFMTAGVTKKMPNDDLFMLNGRYTTCDDHDHPHFYLQLSKAKVRPGKNVVTGPAYLVVEDVPLPIGVPFAFFPFTKDYSSGVIMPTYGDEMRRGFSLRDGGYYFAFSDRIDLALTGEIYTNLSWGLKARSTYRKRYRFSGNISSGYLVNVSGDRDTKGLSGSDYSKTRSFNLTWSHAQDAKANPFSTFSANVNLSTNSYERNDLTRLNAGDFTNNTKASSVNYSYRPPNTPFSFNLATSINQISRDTTLSVTLPSLTIAMRDVFPFKRKEQVGALRWYENIRVSYNGRLDNKIQNVKEYDFFQKNLMRDWQNGMQHNLRSSATFSLFKYITVTPGVDYTNRWYTSRKDLIPYQEHSGELKEDTIRYGFFQVYDYRAQISMNTKLYGMYKPWGIFGEWARKTQIRHVFTPSVSFSGAPDFGSRYSKTITYFDTENWAIKTQTYSPFQGQLYGVPGKGQTGTVSFSVDNNLEMKVPIANTDSTRKVSLIDGLSMNTSYNFLRDSINWSDPTVNLRLKLTKDFTWNVGGVFDIYQYGENGRHINKLRITDGKGFGRFMGTSTTLQYSFSNEKVKRWFTKDDKKEENSEKSAVSLENMESEMASGEAENATRESLRKPKAKDENYDDDGYYIMNIPWNLGFSYSIGFAYDMAKFNEEKREYPYKLTQSNLGISGSISPTKGWSFNFSTSYDFSYNKFTTMQCQISRLMHCWSMSASVIPIGPLQSYNFTISVNSSLLRDLKYTQSSNYRDAMNWGE